jgi:hypothetical protein
MSARSKIGSWDDTLRVAAIWSYWLSIQNQMLDAILSMAGRQDLLLARKVEDLRQTVFDLADSMGKRDA